MGTNPQNWTALRLRPLGVDVADSCKYAFPYVLYCQIWSLGKTVQALRSIRLKNLTHRVPPFKVTQGHRN